jgi:hypothetical protein
MQVRGLNRIKSQKKRKRHHQDYLGLQKQVQSLLTENVRAKNEEVALTRQLKEAQGVVNALHSSGCGSLGRTPSLQSLAPALSHFDQLPLSVLALLEPDPIAPSCIPGRLPPRADPERSFETFLPSTAMQQRSAISGPVNRHTRGSALGTLHDYYDTSAPECSTFHGFATCSAPDPLGSLMRPSEVSLDLNSTLLQTLFETEDISRSA